MPSIFSSVWFWLLIAAILMFIVGIFIFAAFSSGWGVLIIILGVLLLIGAGITGYVTASNKVVIDALNSPTGTELLRQIPNWASGAASAGTDIINNTAEGSLGQVLSGAIARQSSNSLPPVTRQAKSVRPAVGSPRITH